MKTLEHKHRSLTSVPPSLNGNRLHERLRLDRRVRAFVKAQIVYANGAFRSIEDVSCRLGSFFEGQVLVWTVRSSAITPGLGGNLPPAAISTTPRTSSGRSTASMRAIRFPYAHPTMMAVAARVFSIATATSRALSCSVMPSRSRRFLQNHGARVVSLGNSPRRGTLRGHRGPLARAPALAIGRSLVHSLLRRRAIWLHRSVRK